jgi:hypothetical protein
MGGPPTAADEIEGKFVPGGGTEVDISLVS